MFGCVRQRPAALGAQANAAVFMALMEPGATFASLVLADGGHLSHGLPINFSGHYYKPVHYPCARKSAEFEQIDYDAVRAVCEHAGDAVVRLQRVPADDRLCQVPCDRRRGGALPHGGRGASRA